MPIILPNQNEVIQNETRDLEIEKQIEAMINGKYDFIHYNPPPSKFNPKHKKFIKPKQDDNYFNNKVVIIDEVHNFVNTIAKKIIKFKENPLKLKNESHYYLYKMLMEAKNCKLIFLTGTPIINNPNEAGILFNMLRGKIKKFTFTLNSKNKKEKALLNDKKRMNELLLDRLLDINKTIDYLYYDSNNLYITRLPYNFEKFKKSDGEYYLKKCKKIEDYMNNEDFIKNVIKNIKTNILKKKGNIVFRKKNKNRKGLTIENPQDFECLPETMESFNELFLDETDPNNIKIKNPNYFQKRINGMVSYYENNDVQNVMPNIELVQNNQPYQNINDINIEELPFSDIQFELYMTIRKKEIKEKLFGNKKNLFQKSSSTYRSGTRMACNFVFSEAIRKKYLISEKDILLGRPKPQKKGKKKDDNMNNIMDNILSEAGLTADLNKTVENTNNEKPHIILLKKMINNIEYDNMKLFSPKFENIYNKIINPDNVYGHLIYSQFVVGEGLEIFSKYLEYNNFTLFDFKREGLGKKSGVKFKKNIWDFSLKTKEKIEKILDDTNDITLETHPFYMIFSGNVSTERKELSRLIYNCEWDKLPKNASKIKDYLKSKFPNYKKGQSGYGKFIKVFMISASGAEGISLKNTRFVHILEPYWHYVRIDQVIGRAKRICSHNDLDEKFRNVKVFLYLMKYSENQKIQAKGENERYIKNDKGLTTDQQLWNLSIKKKILNGDLLKLIKETAIDCVNSKDIKCVKYAKNPNDYIYIEPGITRDKDIDKHEEQNLTDENYVKLPIKNIFGNHKDKSKHKGWYIKLKMDELDKLKKKKLNVLYNKDVYKNEMINGWKLIKNKQGKVALKKM